MFVVTFLIASAYGSIIECDFKNIYWGIIAVRYTCDEANVINSDTETALSNVIGNHTSGKEDENVEALIVSDEKTLDKLPKDIGKFFPNMLALLWTYGALTSITADDLEQLPKLNILVLSHNKIVSLDESLFKHTPKLQLIEFNDNLIQHADKKLLATLKQLESAEFMENPCINMTANTSREVRDIKLKMPIKCKPITTTTELPTTDSDELWNPKNVKTNSL